MDVSDFADHVITLVRERLPLLDAEDLGELCEAITKLDELPGPVLKFCIDCEWSAATTSTHCGSCGARLRSAA